VQRGKALVHPATRRGLNTEFESDAMPNPLIIDCHLHLYESRDQALWGKDDYEIWEYGDKADVHSCSFAGDVGDALKALSEAGAAKAVAVNLFGVSRAREQAIAGSRLSPSCPRGCVRRRRGAR